MIKEDYKMKTHSIRVLYSFPHKIGADRICYTAWQQVNGLAAAGADILAMPGVLHKPLPPNVKVWPTLSWGKLRISYKIMGTMRALALHDYIVSKRLKNLAGKIDIIHTWPCGALLTLKTAKRLGIPTVLERPNAHTRFAYETYKKECERLGIKLPKNHEYSYKKDVLEKEEKEYDLADKILCPSDFVVKTFIDQGFPHDKLVRHIYGFDEKRFYPDMNSKNQGKGLTLISVGVQAVKKGLHYALEAWLQSPAHQEGTFLVAGEIFPEYAKKLSSLLSHPSVRVLGHRNDVPELMRKSDILILPSIEEGFGLVCIEAMGSGCVPLVSEACTDICKHMGNSLIHKVGDVKTLTNHITMLFENRSLLEKLRIGALCTAKEVTWSKAGAKLLQIYQQIITTYKKKIDDSMYSF
ncbi:glycosyltransferase family 4 protein [Candidatus Bathyarchaeota archaeon]|nr:glycosyltransferase family 4 protein [Candidatus Bathyarchaeota archaeon]